MFTEDEKLLLKLLLKRELSEVEQHEEKMWAFETNSPFLSSVLMSDKDIPFLASTERYHKLLKALDKKLNQEQ